MEHSEGQWVEQDMERQWGAAVAVSALLAALEHLWAEVLRQRWEVEWEDLGSRLDSSRNLKIKTCSCSQGLAGVLEEQGWVEAAWNRSLLI